MDRFWRNLLLVAAAHLFAVAVFFLIQRETRKPSEVMWMDDAGAAPAAAPSAGQTDDDVTTTPAPTPPETARTSAPSELVLPGSQPMPSATPTPTPTPTPEPAPTPKPTPKPKATAKATPKTTPKPKKKPSPKPHASPKRSASPKPSVKPAASEPADDGDDESGATPAKTTAKGGKKPDGAGTAGGAGAGNGKPGGHAGGGATESDFGWYREMIHDRFYSQWEQPQSIINSNEKFSALVKIRIEKDGRVSDVSLAKSSGNTIMDDSVMLAARRVTQIEPLPQGLAEGAYEIKINFELIQNQ